ncbi:hypothetical protein Mycsm_06058 [Mycobacterium sp. JS623]|uniref:hypothetical protein n=1 Tax=Mycobacterium sp. JS623 TaxID=212767 RepID=UPI0002A59F41|nr:hypothetical protein [Mycobacterium sp. JS623]AGB26221.1 hypothetical protein Mycsm_06058 [Mycobacterium sp. JS623]
MRKVFLGSEAVAQGSLTPYELRRGHQRMFRNVYFDKRHDMTLLDRIEGAWLRSGRQAVIAGVAASALHGAQWVADDIPIELIWNYGRSPSGLLVRNEALEDDEITRVASLPVTTRVRTAFDLGRYLPRGEGIARLDSLMHSQIFSIEDVLLLAKRYRGARGLRALRASLPLVDGGAASPQETWLRVLYIDAGLPRPTTQIPIVEGRGKVVRWADMGWEEFMVVSEYDGDLHRTNRNKYTNDIRGLRRARELGWIVDQVIKEDRPADIVQRARAALISRGWRP